MISSREQNLKFYKSAPSPAACLAAYCYSSGEGGQRLGSRQYGLKIPWAAWGEIIPLLEDTWERWHGFSKDKRTGCANILRCSLPEEERYQLVAVELGTGFLLCFTINSELLCSPMTASLGQTGTGHSMVQPSPRGSVRACAMSVPRIWQADMSDTDRMRAGI